MEKCSLANNERMPNSADEVIHTSPRLNTSSSIDSLLHTSSELENTLAKSETVMTRELLLPMKVWWSYWTHADATSGKIGSENSGPANEELTQTGAQRKYACKNLSAMQFTWQLHTRHHTI